MSSAKPLGRHGGLAAAPLLTRVTTGLPALPAVTHCRPCAWRGEPLCTGGRRLRHPASRRRVGSVWKGAAARARRRPAATETGSVVWRLGCASAPGARIRPRRCLSETRLGRREARQAAVRQSAHCRTLGDDFPRTMGAVSRTLLRAALCTWPAPLCSRVGRRRGEGKRAGYAAALLLSEAFSTRALTLCQPLRSQSPARPLSPARARF